MESDPLPPNPTAELDSATIESKKIYTKGTLVKWGIGLVLIAGLLGGIIFWQKAPPLPDKTNKLSVVDLGNGIKKVTTTEDVNGYYSPDSEGRVVFFACSTPIPAKVTRTIYTNLQTEPPAEVPDMQPLDMKQAQTLCKPTSQGVPPDIAKLTIPQKEDVLSPGSATACLSPAMVKDLTNTGSLSMGISKCPVINQMVAAATTYLKSKLGGDYVAANLRYDVDSTLYDFFLWHGNGSLPIEQYRAGNLIAAPTLVYFDDSRLSALDPKSKSSFEAGSTYKIAVLIASDHKTVSSVFTLTNGQYAGSWYDGIKLPLHELPNCVNNPSLCVSKTSYADVQAIAAAYGLQSSEKTVNIFSIDFASSTGAGWAWFLESTNVTPTADCKEGTVSTMEINITTGKTSSIKSVCYFHPIPLENDGKVTVLQKPEVLKLIGQYSSDEVQLKALKFDYIQDKGFMERLLPIYKGRDIGCIIVLTTPSESRVYVEDEKLQTFEELSFDTFSHYLNNASAADKKLFLDNLH